MDSLNNSETIADADRTQPLPRQCTVSAASALAAASAAPTLPPPGPELPQLVGIAGRKGSGKSTAADFLAEAYDYRIVSLADPIKRLAQAVFEIPRFNLWGPSAAREAQLADVADMHEYYWADAYDRSFRLLAPMLPDMFPHLRHPVVAWDLWRVWLDTWRGRPRLTVRTVLQEIGTEWGRSLDCDVWVRLAAADTGHARVVIPDCRFANECAHVRKNGGKVLWLSADTRLGPHTDTHTSEPTLESLADEWDYSLAADFSVDHTRQSIRSILGPPTHFPVAQP